MSMKDQVVQQCESGFHQGDDSGQPLERIYYRRERDGKQCYKVCCLDCADLYEELKEWPLRDDQGRFTSATHCQPIAGLD